MDDGQGRITHANGAETEHRADGYYIQWPGTGFFTGPHKTRRDALRSRDPKPSRRRV